MVISLKEGKSFLDEEIVDAAKRRVASLYKVEVSKLSLDADFNMDLKIPLLSKLAPLVDNPLDILNDDIFDVSDSELWDKLNEGLVKLNTVKDYCEYMVYCYHNIDPDEVIYVLGLDRD